MQALTSKSKPVERKPMNFWEKLYIPAIAKGMAITFSHIFKKKPTINYPEQTRTFSPVFRGVQVLNRDEEGRERCTACGLCAVACPAEAITMEAAERLPGEENLYKEEKYAAKYEINMLRCIFCGLCEEACPKDAVYLSETMVPSNYSRKTFIYSKQELLIPNPVTNPEAFAKARGERPEKKQLMTATQFLFWFLSILGLFSAIMMVVSKNPVHSVLWLIVVFFSISGHYVLLNAQFLAIVNLIVYAGAIMVLFLFVLMLMNLNAETEPQKNKWLKIAGVIGGGALLLVLVAALKDADLHTRMAETGRGDIGLIHNLGMVLFKDYVIPFEISSVLFLSAMVGTVVIGKKD